MVNDDYDTLEMAAAYEATGLRGHMQVAAELRRLHQRCEELEAAWNKCMATYPTDADIWDVCKKHGLTGEVIFATIKNRRSQ